MNPHNRYCKKCYIRVAYLHHTNNIPWFQCPFCSKNFHLYETIGEPQYFKSLDIIRVKKLNKILSKYD